MKCNERTWQELCGDFGGHSCQEEAALLPSRRPRGTLESKEGSGARFPRLVLVPAASSHRELGRNLDAEQHGVAPLEPPNFLSSCVLATSGVGIGFGCGKRTAHVRDHQQGQLGEGEGGRRSARGSIHGGGGGGGYGLWCGTDGLQPPPLSVKLKDRAPDVLNVVDAKIIECVRMASIIKW